MCRNLPLFYYQWSFVPSISPSQPRPVCVYIKLIDEHFIRLMGSAGAHRHPAADLKYNQKILWHDCRLFDIFCAVRAIFWI